MVKFLIYISMNTGVIINNRSKIISSLLVKGKLVEETKVIQKRQIKLYRKKLRIKYFYKKLITFFVSLRNIMHGGVC